MKTDDIIETLADYLCKPLSLTKEVQDTAMLCLGDSLGCAILALNFEECTKLLGPIVPGATVPQGTHIPGTPFILDPVAAAFNIGIMIRWLDYNDTWLAAEWAHPSDNLGAILGIADYLCQMKREKRQPLLTVSDLLTSMVQAYEIQGVLALSNSFNRVGLDHVILVKVASAGIAAKMLGATKDQIINAISQAWIDLSPLRVYRHAPLTGSRKSWAAGDATSRGVFLAHLTMLGEMGYPAVLTAKKWGLNDVVFKGEPVKLERPLGSYVMENILFKVAYPAEFHAQTAVECAIRLHPKVNSRLEEIERIEIATQEPAMRIIDKTGPLHNRSDRDHCLQYMVAAALLHGSLQAKDYDDATAQDPNIDKLRSKMTVKENSSFTEGYYNPDQRSIANAITIQLKDGSSIGPIVIEYPLGHKKRREEATPLLFQKLKENLSTQFSHGRTEDILTLFHNTEQLASMPVDGFMSLFA